MLTPWMRLGAALVALALVAPLHAQGPVTLGYGCTTAFYIDADCDGYGVAVRSSGSYGGTGATGTGLGDRPDADDTDAAINTHATVVTAYDANVNGVLDASELRSFLIQRKGVTWVNDIFYIATTGSNLTGAANNPSAPFASYAHSVGGTAGPRASIDPGDVVIYRAGTYDEPQLGGLPAMRSGTPASPIIVMAMPGEGVTFTGLDTVLDVAGATDLIIDGFRIDNPNNTGNGSGFSLGGTGGADRIRFRNVEIQRFNWPECADDMTDVTIEGLVTHHQREHGLYCAAFDNPNVNLTIRDSIFYKNGVDDNYGGFQHNGRVTGFVFERNIVHSNGQWGISFKMGVSGAIVRNNLIFNNDGHGIILSVYLGDCRDLTGTGGICPFTQTGNVFVNNTIWVGHYNQDGLGSSAQHPAPVSAFLVARESGLGSAGDGLYSQGSNTVINNIIITDGDSASSVPGPAFRQSSPEADPWLSTWTITNNVLYRRQGSSYVAQFGTDTAPLTTYSYATASSVITGFSGNTFADPLLVNEDIDDWDNPQLFNLGLTATSPARGFGASSNAPTDDAARVLRGGTVDAGAYAYASGAPTITWTQQSVSGAGRPGWNHYNRWHWDHVNGSLLIYGVDHTSSSIYSTNWKRYTTATNTWTDIGGTFEAGSTCDDGTGAATQPFPGDRHPVGQTAHDTIRGRIWMVNGVCASVSRDDMWYLALDTGVWTEVDISASVPTIEWEGGMVHDPVADALLLFGNNTVGGNWEVWIYCPNTGALSGAQTTAGCVAANTWRELTPAGLPPAGGSAEANGNPYFPVPIYDPTLGKIVVFANGHYPSTFGIKAIYTYDVSAQRMQLISPFLGQPVETGGDAPEFAVTRITTGTYAGLYHYHRTSHTSASAATPKDYLVDVTARTFTELPNVGGGPARIGNQEWDPSANTTVSWSYGVGPSLNIWQGVLGASASGVPRVRVRIR